MSNSTNHPQVNCNRFEKEAINLIENGQPLDSHFEDCADCVSAKQKYLRLISLIQEQSQLNPSEHWQDSVLQNIAKSKSKKLFRRVSEKMAIAASVLVAGIITFNLYSPALQHQSSNNTSVLSVSIIPSDQQYRGDFVKPGDVLSVSAIIDPKTESELRIYRNGKLVYSCDSSRQKKCAFGRNKVETSYPMNAVGEYQVMIVQPQSANDTDAKPGTSLSGQLSADTADLLKSKAEMTLSKATVVR